MNLEIFWHNYVDQVPGSSLSRVQGYPQDGWYWRMNEWNEWMREERIEADIPWFTQKANKAPDKGLVLFTEAAGALSPEWRHRAPSSQNEDTERLFDRVLEAQAGKWMQRASVLQGLSLKKEREGEGEREREREKKKRMIDTGWLSFGERSPQLNFQKELLYLDLYIEGNERCSHAESAQTLHLFCLYRNQDFFCIPFS